MKSPLANAIGVTLAMSDSRGRLSQQEITQVSEWINKYWDRGSACQVCGHSPMTIGGHAFAAPVVREGGGINLRTSVPFISVDCSRCGHALLFSAVKLGLFGPAAED